MEMTDTKVESNQGFINIDLVDNGRILLHACADFTINKYVQIQFHAFKYLCKSKKNKIL